MRRAYPWGLPLAPNLGDHRPMERTEERDRGQAELEEQGLRFDDPFWDDAFCSWLDPTMRTCCG